MSGYLDTSMIVRYLTGDSPKLADQAARIIDHVEDLRVTNLVLAESAYVLESVYRIARATVVDHLIAFVQKRNIVTPGRDKQLIVQGLTMCRPSGRVSFVDALLWSVARTTSPHRVYTLDRRFPDEGVELIDGH